MSSPLPPFTILASLITLGIGLISLNAASFELGDATALLAPDLLIDEAATGGGDTSLGETAGKTAIAEKTLSIPTSGPLNISITGLAFATSSAAIANDATSVSIEFVYLGADGLPDDEANLNPDDVSIGIVSNIGYNHTGSAGEYVALFGEESISATIDGLNNQFQIFFTVEDMDSQIDETIRFKNGEDNEPKLSIAGTYEEIFIPVTWAGYTTTEGDFVDTGDFMGMLWVGNDDLDWVYSANLGQFIWLTEELAEDPNGAWFYTPAPYEPIFRGEFVDDFTPLSAQPALNNPTTDNWVLKFSDEFNQFDSSKWNITVSTKSRAPRTDKGIRKWFWVEENVSVENGNLLLAVTKPASDTMYNGSVDTKGIYEPLYGFLEARIQIAPVATAASHTAFWLQGYDMNNVDGSGADGAEVDIFESAYSSETTQTVLHWDGYGADHVAATQRWNAPGIHSGYHTFAAHWTEDFIDIYYDGAKVWRYTGVGRPKVQEWLWLSVGASFGDGDFINGTYPAYAYVDYVRVWQSAP